MSPKPRYMQSDVGVRMRAAREANGLSTRDFASKLVAYGIVSSHATVGNYEAGRTEPPEGILAAYAEICRRPVEWLRGEGRRFSNTKYRSLKSARAKEKKHFEGSAEIIIDAMSWLEATTNLRLKESRGASRLNVRPSWAGAALAEELRKNLKLNAYPIRSVNRLLQYFGIRVVAVDGGDRIDAAASRWGKSTAIAVNKRLSPDRMRLTLLHELAHHLYGDCHTDQPLDHEEIESRAFEFASHFLIPQRELQRAIETKSMVHLVQCKERFGISMAAMLFRANQSKLISSSMYRRIMMEFSKLGYRKNEPGRVAEDRPVWFETLVDAAIRQDLASVEEIGRRSGLSREELLTRLDEASGVIPFEELERIPETEPDSFRITHYQKELDT